MNSDETVVGGGNDGWQELPAGTILDNYRIERLLGRGGMGAVYEVEQVRIGRRYAMKVLSSELQRDAEFRRRFETEGRTLAGLDHGHIVTIHYAGEAEVRGQFYAYLVMELLQPLSEWLEHNGPLEERTVREMLTELLTALDYAHSRGVVHRDLKPANLLRSENGDLKVGDFGVAQVVGSDFMRTLVEQTVAQSRVGGAVTQLGSGPSGRGSSSGYAGTLYYMAPEVIEGREATAQSDLYAVGVMAYEWLTGRKPLSRAKAISKLRPDVAAGWDDWVDGLLEYGESSRCLNAATALEGLSDLDMEPNAVPLSNSKPLWFDWKRSFVRGISVSLPAVCYVFLMAAASYQPTDSYNLSFAALFVLFLVCIGVMTGRASVLFESSSTRKAAMWWVFGALLVNLFAVFWYTDAMFLLRYDNFDSGGRLLFTVLPLYLTALALWVAVERLFKRFFNSG